jgi:hypothetical protein
MCSMKAPCSASTPMVTVCGGETVMVGGVEERGVEVGWSGME